MMTQENWLADIRDMATLHAVFSHAMKQEPKWIPEDVIIQDEYTSDAIFRVRDNTFLVLDATRLGGVLSASVWDHLPTADELLRSRLDQGWQPTPSQLKVGPVILGHAASTTLAPHPL